MDISFFLRNMATDFKDESSRKIAIKEEIGRAWTYSDLHRISNAYADRLYELGIGKGDRVGILLYNCLEYFGLYFAIAKIGAIAVRLNFRLSSAELEFALNDSQTKVVCFHSDLASQLEKIRDRVSVEQYICLPYIQESIPSWATNWSYLENGSSKSVNVDHIKLHDPVMLMYTSGTTGRPKGAIWTHDTVLWFSAIQALKWNFSGEEVGMTTGPLYHVGAMEDIALPILMMGGTVIITKSQGFQIKRILSVIEHENVTHCFLFPFMIYEMLHSDSIQKYNLKSIKTIYTGGDPLMPWALEQLKKNYPHIGVVQVYGLTEGQPIASSLDPQDNFIKGHTVGKPMPFTEINIIDANGTPVPIGNVGEIIIKSPAVSIGYWRNHEATLATFINGWCKTGDLGKFDQDGYLIIAGRKKDMIRSGGENIYSAEIEDILYRHKDVAEAAIIGIPDPKYIEIVCAVIVKKKGSVLTEENIIDYCKEYLASYKKPRKVIFVDEIPRTPSGKVQKFILREQYSNSSL